MIPRLAVFGSLFARLTDLADEGHACVFYVGLGDLLDDDRRLVRAEASPPSAEASYPATGSRTRRHPQRAILHC